MPTDTTITRYGSTGANQGFAMVVRPDGPWVRYEDHERALTAAHAARDAAEERARALMNDALLSECRKNERDALRRELTTALRERDEARAALEWK